MKAIILAAGKGERLKEITDSLPKPMIKIKGKPILQHNIELCRKYGIEDIFINVHHLPEKITDYFGSGEKYDVNIKYSFEKDLLGTSGAVKKIAKEFWNYPLKNSNIKSFQSLSPFFIVYGDQISEFDLNLLTDKYTQHDCLGVIAFHYRNDVEHSGVAEFDKNFRIQRFIEKPKSRETESHWVNAGIYILSPEILNYIPKGFSDFGKQIFPTVLDKNKSLYGVCKRNEVKVFDTPEMYKKNIGG